MDENSAPIKQRILEYIEYKGLKKGEFFAQINVSPSNFRSKSLKSEVGGEVIAKILSLYEEINPLWLLNGKGSMLYSYNPCEQLQKSHIEDGTGVLLPVYNSEASAGGGELTLSSEYVVDEIMVPFAREGDTTLTIVGNSMNPIINSGDLAVTRQLSNWQEYVEYGKIFIVVTVDEVFCKVVQKSGKENHFTLHSYNESYDDFDVPKKYINSMHKVIGIISQRSF